MSKLKSDRKISKPGTLCEPARMPQFESVVTLHVKDVSGLVQREVNAYLASLPYAAVTCITVQKAAELLCCYEDTVRCYIRSGQLMASKLGNDYRIRIEDLDKFLQDNRTKAVVRRMHNKQKKVS